MCFDAAGDAGQYCWQVVGTTASGGLLSADPGLQALDAKTQSISIAGDRAKKTKPAGEGVWSGAFTWRRKTGRKVYVYFTSGDVRSNRIIIPSNRR